MPAIDRLPLPPQLLQQVILWPWHLGHKNLLGISSLPFSMGPEIAATDSFLCPSGVGSSTTQSGDLACHQMNFAASAIRPPTAMNNTAICTHRLFAKLLVFPFPICVSIAGLPSADSLAESEHSDMLQQLLSFEVYITKPYRSRHAWRPPRQSTQAP
jgi:hypothetical protein